jgi:hypothetical protein
MAHCPNVLNVAFARAALVGLRLTGSTWHVPPIEAPEGMLLTTMGQIWWV